MNEGSTPAEASAGTAPTNQTAGSPAAAVASQVSGAQNTGAASTENHSEGSLDMVKIFGEDFTKDPALKDFKDPASFVKAFKDTKAMVGKPRFDVPGQDAPPEQVSDFYKKLGVPETPDAYGLKADANVPEHNNETNVAFLKAFGDQAHELKLTKSQAEGMQKFFDDLAVNVGKTQAEAQAAEDAQLNSLLSKALGGENLDIAAGRIKADIEKVLPPEMRDLLANKVSNEALAAIALIEKHYRITYGMSDKNAGDQGSPSGRSQLDLQKEARDLMGSKEYQNPIDPGHKAVREKVNALYKTIGELTNAAKRS